ncbi:hypothetical protein [Sphingobium yanoikuyae]|uniref:hypothetical protein n=1 Tax=Sphingobium yanoikuyae TaxID=13690 RepID=UPI0022DD32DA|nr:hypothetical protein [Sphingobium yanoikuyae]WBQ19307.1 hypothetical protein PAE53_23220 [Sphingobium yanoikuyae]
MFDLDVFDKIHGPAQVGGGSSNAKQLDCLNRRPPGSGIAAVHRPAWLQRNGETPLSTLHAHIYLLRRMT